jgi:hypothetical protein
MTDPIPKTKTMTCRLRPNRQLPDPPLKDVNDLYVAPLLSEIFRHQSAVAMVRFFLTAK